MLTFLLDTHMAEEPLRTREYTVADRLHSAAIHLLRLVRVRDLKTGIGPARLSALSVLVFVGPKSLKELAEIEQVLTERGLHFGMDLSKLKLDDE